VPDIFTEMEAIKCRLMW